MKELTRAEEQIMQVLWDLGKGFVKDIIDKLPEPRPAYNTVSTMFGFCRIKDLSVTKLWEKSLLLSFGSQRYLYQKIFKEFHR